MPISAFIICMNEQSYLRRCIESLYQMREIVIVNSGSTDDTILLIKSLIDSGWPIRLFQEPWRGYAGQKQFALDRCTQPWCLNIDADERLDDTLQSLLPDLTKPGEVAGWRIGHRPYLPGFGYTPQRMKAGSHIRLVRREQARYDLSRTVHESLIVRGPVISLTKGSLLHYRPLPLKEQLLKENEYSTLKAQSLITAGKPARRLKLIFNPAVYFVRTYFFSGYWRCGMAGFIHAMDLAVYSFLTEAKMYQYYAMHIRPCSEPDEPPRRYAPTIAAPTDPADR